MWPTKTAPLRLRIVAFALTTLLPLHANAAPLADTGVSYRLGYQAPLESCPTEEGFRAEIHGRAPRARLADRTDATAISVDVTMDITDAATTGSVVIVETDGSRQERKVSGVTCLQVARALALIIALLLDPDAESVVSTIPPPAEPHIDAPRPVPRVSEAPAPSTTDTVLTGGGQLGGFAGVGPGVAPLVGAFVELSLLRGSSSLLQPSVRLGGLLAATSNDLPVGSQQYLLAAGSVGLCPVHVAFGSLRLGAPCISLQVGAHRGSVSGVPRAGAQTDLWLAPALTGELSWQATPRLSFELSGGVASPLRQTRFFLAPDTTIFRVPTVGGLAALAVMVDFR